MPEPYQPPPKLQKLYDAAKKLGRSKAIHSRLKALSTTLSQLRKDRAEKKT